ncbi:hypothetical protein [Peribacillus saganii]|uniref:hypothetical protein n=1 Tax=Peribacillus saganii TaxID=2303992 RepID=UPI0013142ACD|nr:hypothetical protein [Peribacillus saganii]
MFRNCYACMDLILEEETYIREQDGLKLCGSCYGKFDGLDELPFEHNVSQYN